MLKDRYGLTLSTSSTAARDAYVAGCDCILSAAHGEALHLARALEADPDFALAHVALARSRFLMADVPGARAAATRRVMDEARAGLADAVLDTHGVDVLAIPTTPNVAPTIEEIREHPAASGRIVAWTGVFDFTGQPAIAVPCGLTQENLPASISFVGRRWDEASILRAARAYEMVRGEWPSPAH